MKMILFLCNFVLLLTQKAAVGLIMILICLAEIHNNHNEIMWSPLSIYAVLPTFSTFIVFHLFIKIKSFKVGNTDDGYVNFVSLLPITVRLTR